MNKTELSIRLIREANIIASLSRQALTPALGKLPRNHYFLLNHLTFTSNRGATPGDLARAFLVSAPAMTQTLKAMRSAGLVTMNPAPDDQRAKTVQITPAGTDVLQQVTSQFGKQSASVARRANKAGLAQLLAQLRQFRESLEQVAAAADSNSEHNT